MVLLAVAGTLSTAPSDGFSGDHQAMTLSWELLKTAQYGQAAREHAAFLVRKDGGELEMVPWPVGESHRADYRGSLPAGTIAIIHTHPKFVPNPSNVDEALARRLGVPVYVLTRTGVTRTDGSRIELVARGDWNPTR
jgi:proteasome lid subunit RPN8/RPN11